MRRYTRRPTRRQLTLIKLEALDPAVGPPKVRDMRRQPTEIRAFVHVNQFSRLPQRFIVTLGLVVRGGLGFRRAPVRWVFLLGHGARSYVTAVGKTQPPPLSWAYPDRRT